MFVSLNQARADDYDSSNDEVSPWQDIIANYITPCIDIDALAETSLDSDEDAQEVCSKMEPFITCAQGKVDEIVDTAQQVLVDTLLGKAEDIVTSTCQSDDGRMGMLAQFKCLFINPDNKAALTQYTTALSTFGQAALNFDPSTRLQTGCASVNIAYKAVLGYCNQNCDSDGVNAVTGFFDQLVSTPINNATTLRLIIILLFRLVQ